MMVRAMVSSEKSGSEPETRKKRKSGSDPMVREVVAHSVSLRATTCALGGSGSRRNASWHIGGRMIRNDQELAVTRERVAKFERMQRDILDYLVQAPPGAK